jgi:electron transport complex protein RnfB
MPTPRARATTSAPAPAPRKQENDARLAAKAVAKMQEVTQEVPATPDELAEKSASAPSSPPPWSARAKAASAAAKTDIPQHAEKDA